MRRFASVFAPSSKRSDKSDVPSSAGDASRPHHVQKKSRAFPSLSRKHLSSVGPPSPPPLVASELVNSSSSSSSGSTTLRTPDDDGLPRTSSKKGSWKSWLGAKNAAASDHSQEHRPPPWQSSQELLRPPQPGPNEADDASSHSDVPYGNHDDSHATSLSPQQMATARANAHTMIMNSLVREPTLPPLLHLSGAISFPRSCHNSCRLRRRETFESALHKKSLLTRLDRLSPSAESSIVPLASKVMSPRTKNHLNLQDDVFPLANSVSLYCSGLENWVSRPCFEDRLQLWTRSDSGEVRCTRIPGSHLGVAALEFSESLELLAGTLLEEAEANIAFDPVLDFALPPLALNLDPPATQVKQVGLDLLPPPLDLPQPKDPRFSPSSSLPRTNGLLALSKPSSPVPQPDESTTSGSAATNDFAPKRGVRFADDDGKDDQIPLGYVLRIRKNKEQKARFLREERERRERAAQLSVENRRTAAPPQDNHAPRLVVSRQRPSRPLISLAQPSKLEQPATVSQDGREEERLRREVERIEMEKLRRSRELARKQSEERERAFLEELQATRARREASRAGRPLESAPSSRVLDPDRSASRDSMYASLRRTSMSHKHTPELVFSPVAPHEGSPSGSAPVTPGSQYSFSRPPSLHSAHTASSEDIRGRDGKRASRRMSVVSDSGKGMSLQPPFNPRVSFNPYAWTNAPLVSAIPPVPSMPIIPMVNGMPFYGADMPLLPPTPPFMMNQFGARPRSYTGLAGHHSALQSPTSFSRNYSSEGVNSGSRNSSPHSSGSHQRRSSDEATQTVRTPGDSRTRIYNDGRGSKTSVPVPVTPSQSNAQRSSLFPSEPSSTRKSSRPVSGGYPSGAPANVRRQTAA